MKAERVEEEQSSRAGTEGTWGSMLGWELSWRGRDVSMIRVQKRSRRRFGRWDVSVFCSERGGS